MNEFATQHSLHKDIRFNQNMNILILSLASIMQTSLCNEYPHTPHFFIVKLGCTRVYNVFLNFALKHRLWVLVRTASLRRFWRVPTIYVLSKNKKMSCHIFSSENYYFYSCEILQYIARKCLHNGKVDSRQYYIHIRA